MPSRYGRRSVFLAVGTFVLAFGSLLALGISVTDLPEPWKTPALVATCAVILLVAPILHITGAYLGLKGLRAANDSLLASGIGALLNIGLLVTGAYLLWSMLPGMTAFR